MLGLWRRRKMREERTLLITSVPEGDVEEEERL